MTWERRHPACFLCEKRAAGQQAGCLRSQVSEGNEKAKIQP